MNDLYYICNDKLGIVRFEDNDTMPSILANNNKDEWYKFTEEQADIVSRFTGWDIIEVV